ncbi:MAG: hypothetical protein K0U49_08580, partial [Alphaproteobacteria bacterium]|nr:hypothetical protein [Alphaproteobacteria bacterium]
MALKTRTTWSKKLDRLRRTKRVRTGLAFSLVLLGPILALTTFLVLGPLDQGASAPALRLILLADFVSKAVI